MPNILNIYVSKEGEAKNDGLAPYKKDNSRNGSVSSVHEAVEKVRELYSKGNSILSVKINILEGVYYFSKPLVFKGIENISIYIKNYNDGKVVFDGGRKIENWENDCINGVRVLKAFIPDVKLKTWNFRQLFVNKKRCERTRLPKNGIYEGHGVYSALGRELSEPELFDGSYYIKFKDGDIKNFKNINDVEIVVDHKWINERMPIKNIDYKNCIVTSRLKSVQKITSGYYIENIFEELNSPGQWYLDKESGYVYYVPFEGETKDSIDAYAPVLKTIIDISGVNNKSKIYNKHFDGIEMRNTSALYAPPNDLYATSIQAEEKLPSSIGINFAENISFRKCNLYNMGNYAIGIGYACRNISISKCSIHDIAGGGIKISGADTKENITRYVHIMDNHIYNLGRIYKAAIGIFCQNACDNIIAYNHIHHVKYTGISCGWVWGYSENVSKNNIIEYNHIHDIGYSELSDMGGIYTLGVQPGTVVRGNHIHDIKDKHYGGWCIYPDEGSSHIIIENNICYNAKCESFHQHYGRENIVRNNIFVSGENSTVRLTRLEEHQSFTFTRNILVTMGPPIYSLRDIHDKEIISESNLFYSYNGDLKFKTDSCPDIDMDEWKKTGNDRFTIIADPKFKDISNYDFTLLEDSPAFNIGFIPISAKDAGIREE